MGHRWVSCCSNFARDVILVYDWFLKEHMQTFLVLSKWMTGHSGKDNLFENFKINYKWSIFLIFYFCFLQMVVLSANKWPLTRVLCLWWCASGLAGFHYYLHVYKGKSNEREWNPLVTSQVSDISNQIRVKNVTDAKPISQKLYMSKCRHGRRWSAFCHLIHQKSEPFRHTLWNIYAVWQWVHVQSSSLQPGYEVKMGITHT